MHIHWTNAPWLSWDGRFPSAPMHAACGETLLATPVHRTCTEQSPQAMYHSPSPSQQSACLPLPTHLTESLEPVGFRRACQCRNYVSHQGRSTSLLGRLPCTCYNCVISRLPR